MLYQAMSFQIKRNSLHDKESSSSPAKGSIFCEKYDFASQTDCVGVLLWGTKSLQFFKIENCLLFLKYTIIGSLTKKEVV